MSTISLNSSVRHSNTAGPKLLLSTHHWLTSNLQLANALSIASLSLMIQTSWPKSPVKPEPTPTAWLDGSSQLRLLNILVADDVSSSQTISLTRLDHSGLQRISSSTNAPNLRGNW